MLNRDKKTASKSKHDNIEFLTLIDKCAQIIKDDKLMLRQQIKENNVELINLISKYKRKTELQTLQQELRKFIVKFKGKAQAQFSQQLYQVHSKENNQNVNIQQKINPKQSFISNISSNTNTNTKIPLQDNNRQNTKNKTIIVAQEKANPKTNKSQSAQRTTAEYVSDNKYHVTFKPNPHQHQSSFRLKQEFSPRFNNYESENHQTRKSETNIVEFLNKNQIEDQKRKLEQFEQKLNLYQNQDTNFSNLWYNEANTTTNKKTKDIIIDSQECLQSERDYQESPICYDDEVQVEMESHKKEEHNQYLYNRHDPVIASFQNPKPQSQLNQWDSQCQSPQQEQSHKQSPTKEFFIDFNHTAPLNSYDYTSLQVKNKTEITPPSLFEFTLKDNTQLNSQTYSLKDNLGDESSYNFQQKENLNHYTHSLQESYVKNQIPKIDDDEIMRKYADLFTAPDFLKQCQMTVQSFKTESSFQTKQSFKESICITDNKMSWNFMIPCQSVVCQNVQSTKPQETKEHFDTQHWEGYNSTNLKISNVAEQVKQLDVVQFQPYNMAIQQQKYEQEVQIDQKSSQVQEYEQEYEQEQEKVQEVNEDFEINLEFWKVKLQVFENYAPEQIFDEIFSENTLNKISKAFFRFKIESLLVQIYDQCNLTCNEIDELFSLCDLKRDGFVDVNELGWVLDRLCSNSQDIHRKIYKFFDREEQGFFTKRQMKDALYEIQEQCEVSEIEDLVELGEWLNQ